MKHRKKLNQKRVRRMARTKMRISGQTEKPRLVIFRSNRFVSAQLIDDKKGHTMAFISSKGLAKGNKTDLARKAGESIAKKAKDLGVSQAVFDRRHYRYHGRVKAFVEGARSGGLKI